MSDDRKSVLVTGASRGIGRSCAIRFAKAGYRVGIGYSGNKEKAEETEKAVAEFISPDDIILLQGDVSEEESAQRIMDEFLSKFSRIDCLVNSAGITRDNLIAMMKPEDFDRVINVNLRGTFLMCRAAFRPMMKQRGGHVVNISSIVGLHGNAGQTNYSASKAGAIGLTMSLAKEGAGRNILYNAVAPGFVETDMTSVLPEKTKNEISSSIPLKRPASPDEIADAVYFLGAEDNTYITGQTITVDGGMSL